MSVFDRLGFGGVTHVMGVINLSRESRNLHTVAAGPAEALEMARRYRELGATVIDLGGQSSHYDNPTLPADEEIARIVPSLRALVDDDFLVSIDTWKPEVAAACLDGGASIINDTGGLTSPEMIEVIANHSAAAVAVYVEGANPHEVDAIDTSAGKAARTAEAFSRRLQALDRAGLKEVILDPGIALNYRSDYEAYTRLQIEVIRDSRELHELGRPVLIPIPRKQELARVLALIALALEYEADLIRVHDVAEACEIARFFGRLPGESS